MPSFAAMEARIIAELKRSDIASVVDDFINDAINHYSRYRFWFNEGSSTASTSSGTATYNWPATLVQLDSMTITVNGKVSPLRPVSPGEIDEMYSGTTDTGVPWCFANYGQQFRLYPIPDGTYTLTYYYLKTFTALTTGSATSNVWTTEAEELIRTRAKKLILQHYQDDLDKVGYYDQMERDILAGLQKQTQASTRSGRFRSWAV